MYRYVSLERWAALRALREGEAPTFSLLAAAANLNVTTIRDRATRYNWVKQPFQSRKKREAWAGRGQLAALATGEGTTPDLSELEALTRPEDQIAWLGAYMVRALAKLIASANAGVLDKAEIDALSSLMRMLERSKALAVGVETRTDNQTDDDEDLAEALRRIDDRIIELAEAHAKWLVGGEGRGEAG
jgi:hypothetical protein